MKRLQKLAVLSALVVGALSSYAATERTFTSVGDLTLDRYGSWGYLYGTFNGPAVTYGPVSYNSFGVSFSGDATDSYKFQDTFNFSLEKPLDGASVLLSNWGVAGWSAALNGVALNATAGTWAGGLAGTADLIAGTNTLVVSGHSLNGAPSWFNGTGTYNFSLSGTVSAVPEPETFAMLLAGLGVLGAVARRHKALTV